MNEDVYWLGPCPADEDAVQVGAPDYDRDAKAQCRAYMEAVRKVVGREPDGARLAVRGQRHDYGTYYELAVIFDGDNREAADYAAKCEEHAPTTWAEAGMEWPLTGRSRGR